MESFGQKQENAHDASLMPRPPLLLLLVCSWLAAAAGPARPPGISAADLLNLRQLETPALSPDGRWVVYVVRSIEPKPGDATDWTYRTQLWLAAADGSAPPRQLTFDAAGHTSPVWSPAGDRLAFVRTAEKGKPALCLLALAGGEAETLAQPDTGAVRPRWSPDGRRLLFASTLSYAQVRAGLEKLSRDPAPAWEREKPGRRANDTANWRRADPAGKATAAPAVAAKPDGTLAEIREWLARNEAEANPRVTDRLNFLGEGTLEPEPDFLEFSMIDARAGAEARAVTTGYENFADAEWLADGAHLVCVGPRKFSDHPDRARLTNSLYVLEVATGAARVLLEEPGNRYAEPQPSPDGKWIACAVTTGGEFSFEQAMLAIVPTAGGAPVPLTPQLDRSVTRLRWHPDGRSIYCTAPDRGHFPLYRVALEPREVQTLTSDLQWGIGDFAVAGGRLVQVVTHPGNPWELYASADDGRTPRPLTAHNSAWLRDRTLSAVEPHHLVNAEGITVDYWTMKPAGFDAARKYPLLVEIHGGPSAMWGPGEATSWHELQFFAARGYALVFSNPRGSGGYGRDFMRANYRDWGTGPARDVLAAADFAAKEPYIDRQRQVITGGSYGGYLTAWIVGHDHRFKAAVAQRGVYDLATFYGEGNAWFLLPLYWGGYPWQADVRALLTRDSPLTYVENITTPLLIKHGDVDYRTGVTQSQILYKSLKQLGREVEYARYPAATHELSRSGEPRQRLDRLVRYEEFFRRYVGETDQPAAAHP